ncbi:hypothetical protein MLC59_02160 [Marinobacter bryozoorum]|uniref:hypothetical protein n=1 Tax=Marinobacter bryozoorum TaxID=256324 RepID=UPI0020060518|nr:hypothetical protein [Marinobacter bryozoorum]MCK7542974.1 hypothetical protein [Marinobacter bryozoorum]
MLTISAPVFDINGTVIAHSPDMEGLQNLTRRVSRAATLDGQAAINDFGFTDADRDLSVEWTPATLEEMENVRRMFKTYSRLVVSFSEGCFLAAPESFSAPDGQVSITLFVDKRLSE